MSDKRESRPPRTGGKPGDRQDRREGGRRDGGKGDRGNRGNQPKYDDTQESRGQKKRMQEIDQEIEGVQRAIEKAKGKSKLVVRRARPRLTNKVTIEENITKLAKNIETKEKSIKEEQQAVKKLLDNWNERKQVLNRLKLNVFVPNIGSLSQTDFVRENNKKLNEEINKLEKKLETESLSINEEKSVVREIKRIKAMKGNFEVYYQRAREARDAERLFKDRDGKLKDVLSYIERDKQDLENYKQDLLSIDQREKEAKKLEEEEKQKKELEQKKEQDEVSILQNKLTELLKQLEEAKEAYRNNRDKWYQSKREERDKKYEELNQERNEKRKEKEKEEREKIANERLQRKLEIPYESEITSCQNLINYLSEILSNSKTSGENKGEQPKTETKEEGKKEEGKKETGYIKGKEEVEDLLFQGATTAPKKKKAAKKKKTNTKITHNWDTFTRFSELGLGEPPIVATEIPASLEKLRSKLAEFQKLSKEKKVEILKQIEEEEKKEEEERKKALQREQEEKEKKATTTTTAPTTTEKKEEPTTTSTEVKKDN